MRKLVLLFSVSCWTAPETPAAEIEPFQPPGQAAGYVPCAGCNAKPRRPLLQRREAQACCPTCNLPAACCPTCGQAWPASACGDTCLPARKERRWLKIAKWLCYVPTRTRCEKQPDPCCRPPLYQYFTCCQPPCGGIQPPSSWGPVACRGCE